MSLRYPPPRYAGEHGEATASFRRADAAPDLTYANGNTVHYLSTGASTSGDFGLFDGTSWNPAGPGDYVHVPPGGIHGFRNEDGPASMLLLFAPGAPREGYFEGLAELASATADQRAAFFGSHDNIWL